MKKRYSSIDGLRAISCLGIIAMHILYNTDYQISGFFYEKFIPSCTWLVYLFLMISGFGMCAGYLERFWNNQITMENFYKRRYQKILPFFGTLLLIALILEPSFANVYEASVEITMLHGLLPNNAVSVLGVCWTLGVIFVFYLLFPAFSVLMKTPKRAWAALIVSLWLNFCCQQHFFSDYFVTRSFTPRHSFLYCAPLFLTGGLIYLYRETVVAVCRKFRFGVLAAAVLASTLYFIIPEKIGTVDVAYLVLLVIFALWLSYAVGAESRFLGCRAMKFLSGISMEMYLAQMVIFRVIEKCHLLYWFGKGWGGFLASFLFTIVGLIVFILCWKAIWKWMEEVLKKREN